MMTMHGDPDEHQGDQHAGHEVEPATPGSPACRKSPKKNLSGSLPQALSIEKNV